MEKLINELLKMAEEGYEEVIIAWDKNFNNISVNLLENKKAIPEEYIIDTLDLSVYNSYNDIKEEIESMLED